MTIIAQQPDITITTLDYDRLCNLAESAARNSPDVAAFLLEELSRAHIAPQPSETPVVRMGSRVRFRDETGESEQQVQLVYPPESDSRHGRISVLTPIGAALIGLSEGQTIKWRDRRGSMKSLTVLAVQSDENAS